MHEFSMAEELLDVVKANASANNAKKVISVKLKISNLSLITSEAISLSFKAVSKGTIAEGAALIIERMPVVVRCRGCGLEAVINIPEDTINKIKDTGEHEHHNPPFPPLVKGGNRGIKVEVRIYPLIKEFFNCHNCGSKDFDIISSDEIYLERVELDV